MNLRQQLERAIDLAPPRRREAIVFHASRIGLALLLAVFTYVLFPASPAVDFPIYEVGSVASDNVIAPFAFKVLKTTDELQREREALVRAAEPIYAYVPAALDSARAQLAGLADAVENAARVSPDLATVVAAIQRAGLTRGLTFTPQEAQYLANPGRRSAMFSNVRRAFDRWLGAGVTSSGALDEVRGDIVLRVRGEDRRVPADSILTFNMLASRAALLEPDPGSVVGRELYRRLVGALFHPTIVADRAASELRRQELSRSVSTTKYEVLAGEKIVGANEVVGREEHEKLRALHDAVEGSRGSERGARRVVGAILFNALIIGLLGLSLVLFRPQVYRTWRWVLMFALSIVLVVLGAFLVAQTRPVRPELVPVALAVVVISALFDQRIAMITAMVLAILVGFQSAFRGTNALFVNLVGGAVAAFSVRAINRRNQSYYWILSIAAAYCVTAVAIGLALDLPTRDLIISAAFGALNALVCVLLALLLLPMAESFTGIETDLTLLEWSDLNRPLMQRLSLEAPGTYMHTIAMANLADSACRAIGANGLLARVGAYYHDIGKLAKPQYFVENQPKGRNPHDKLKPGTSAQIIRNHVRDGLELAEEYKLPKALRAFITEHHGTGSISYFLEKARERDGAANSAEFAYPGPIPQSAETAVVMLADGIEASVRVLAEPTTERIRDVVDHIVKQRMDQGQLRDAPLTLRQIDMLREEFTRVLAGMYHNRVEYPASSGGITSEFASA